MYDKIDKDWLANWLILEEAKQGYPPTVIIED